MPNPQEEVNLLIGVRREIEHKRRKFERMTHFLIITDAIEEKHLKLKVSVKQVREATYGYYK